MAKFVISDTHFGHDNILKFEPEFRPFSNIDEMNEHIIQEWNKVVKHDDVVYHLGDVYFGNKKNLQFVRRLNGKKHLVLGNHDTHTTMQEFAEVGFQEIYGMFKLNRQFIVSHAPIHSDEFRFGKVTHNIHGHTHSRLILDTFGKPDARYINVSVERAKFAPVNLDNILEYQQNIMKNFW